MASDDEDELLKTLSIDRTVDNDKLLVLLEERQHQMIRRLIALERKQEDTHTLINRGIGGATVIMGIGILVGWVSSVFGSIGRWIHP